MQKTFLPPNTPGLRFSHTSHPETELNHIMRRWVLLFDTSPEWPQQHKGTVGPDPISLTAKLQLGTKLTLNTRLIKTPRVQPSAPGAKAAPAHAPHS